MRSSALGLALLLAGCHGSGNVRVDVAFDVDADGRAASAKCLSSAGGACQIAFREPIRLHVALHPGEMRRFDNVGPGASVCVEADMAALADCRPTRLEPGYARIRKREDQLARRDPRQRGARAKSG